MTDYGAYQLDAPPVNATTDDSSYTMGLEFFVTQQAWAKRLAFWQPSGNSPSSAVRKGALWQINTASTGTNISGTLDFPATVSGWNFLDFPELIELTPNQRYKACVLHPAGRYPSVPNYYSLGAGSTNFVNGPLTVPSAANSTIGGSDGGQNTFRQVASMQFPFDEFNSNIYYIDVIVTDEGPVTVTNKSISDIAREQILDALVLSEPQNKSNVDLMKEVIDLGGLGLITVNTQTAAEHYQRFLKIVRDGL